MMWEIVSCGGLGHRCPIPKSWDRGEGEEKDMMISRDVLANRDGLLLRPRTVDLSIRNGGNGVFSPPKSIEKRSLLPVVS